ncbi:MAG TPA: hypothetical protein VF053_08785 [Streptosporangiales bacterium]
MPSPTSAHGSRAAVLAGWSRAHEALDVPADAGADLGASPSATSTPPPTSPR